MDDNQLVKELVATVVKTVNGSCLPLAVKALALENLLLRVEMAMNAAAGAADAAVPAAPEKEVSDA